MGELLDRNFQRQLLGELRDIYPHAADVRRSWGEQPDNRLLVNLVYLDEHGLVTLSRSDLLSGEIRLHSVSLTAKGMDFLADDGSLSAILGVVTVKLHDDSIRDLLIKRIEAAEGERTAKQALIDKIRSLPAEALGKLTMDGLNAALSQVPRLVELLGKLLA